MEWQPIKTVPKDEKVLLYFPMAKATPQARSGAPEMIQFDHIWRWDYGGRMPTHWAKVEPPVVR